MFDWFGAKLSQFADWLLSAIHGVVSWFESIVSQVLGYIYTLPLFTYELICKSIVKVFDAIPVPSFFGQAGNLFSSIPSSVLFYVAPLQLGFGITVLISAYTLRFLIRRIPFIG